SASIASIADITSSTMPRFSALRLSGSFSVTTATPSVISVVTWLIVASLTDRSHLARRWSHGAHVVADPAQQVGESSQLVLVEGAAEQALEVGDVARRGRCQ